MEKRVLLAVVLSFIVLYSFQAMFPPPEPPQAPTAADSAPASGTPAQTGTQPIAPAIETESLPPQAAVVGDSEEREIVVENESVRAVFSNRGGVIKSWRLKKYMGAGNEPQELVPQNLPDQTVRPLTLSVDDPAVSRILAGAIYHSSATALDVTSVPQTLTFEFQTSDGLAVRKDLAFHPDSPYVIHLTASVRRGSEELNPTVHWGPSIGSAWAPDAFGYNQTSQPIFYTDGDVERIGPSDVPSVATREGTFGFAGVDDHYFLSSVVEPPSPLRLHYGVVPAPPFPDGDPAPPFVDWAVRFPNPPNGAAFFFGPKDFDVLAAVDRDLVRAIHFGIFSWLVVPLLRALKWVNVYIGNYGWSIIALTVIINVVMFPFRHKSVVSMRKMQEIQPQVKAIQDRYAKLKMTDPARQKMNTELMELYRQKGVNPVSGCLPMLMTLPVLFAFYSMLSVAIELRGAPFIGWIKDLSTYDPLFITPVLMGLTQFVQTKMTPSTMDPTQQRVMLLMPLIFMFMFIWAPSGLVLYWTVSNLWAIGQQAVTNRIIGKVPERNVRPAAERRVKVAGGGKTEPAKERK